jgi:hypothetical protein
VIDTGRGGEEEDHLTSSQEFITYHPLKKVDDRAEWNWNEEKVLGEVCSTHVVQKTWKKRTSMNIP